MHRDPADGPPGEAAGRSQAQGLLFFLEQVDGADLGAHAFGDQGDNVVEGFVQVVGLEDEGADVLQG
jgi:hypothetical protein